MKDWIILGLLLVIILILIFNTKTVSTFQTGIPKIIHQTAPSDKSKWPEIWYRCQESWRTHFPDYEYRMWTDEDLDNFMKDKYPEYWPMYQKYPRKIQRIDAARYFILHEYGGIYADMDFECLRPFMHRVDETKVGVAESQHIEDNGEEFQNALMISPEKHPFWLEVFKDLKEHANDPADGGGPIWTTGPQVIVRTYKKNSHLMQPLPRANFAPKTVPHSSGKETFTDEQRADPEIFTVHHGTYSWGNI